ncbi:hypothetical protein PR002_g32902 [Phytophthora rubi]|uniref:Uncharacterized protein n=1 Tax=Phytophthora rubi TaxID=129364 RepID=A0A6A3G2Q0_9STRA|nr:hypothetical protein PR002_g32902 [Phytophthora rubi]
MILEYKINHTDWPYLMPMVQASLNHTAVPSLGNKAPVELFTGLPCPTPLREFYLPDAGELKEVPEIDKIDEFLADLRASIQEMHRAVKDKRLKQRLLNKKREREWTRRAATSCSSPGLGRTESCAPTHTPSSSSTSSRAPSWTSTQVD